MKYRKKGTRVVCTKLWRGGDYRGLSLEYLEDDHINIYLIKVKIIVGHKKPHKYTVGEIKPAFNCNFLRTSCDVIPSSMNEIYANAF